MLLNPDLGPLHPGILQNLAGGVKMQSGFYGALG